MTSFIDSSTTILPRQRSAQHKIAAFTQKFGDAHLYLSYHAAFPLSLTPELLYQMWANFQTNQTGKALNIPWIATADLLLSGLCREVGYELYEMHTEVKIELLSRLQNDPQFGPLRIQQLAEFVLIYIQHQLNSPDLDMREVARTQRWTALAYTRPGTVTRELIDVLASLNLSESAEWLRFTSLIETLADPLAEFKPLLSYSRGMKYFMRGQIEEATDQLLWLAEAGQIRMGGVELPVPEQIRRNLVASEGKQAQPVAEYNSVHDSATQENLATFPVQDTHAPIITLLLKLTPDDVTKATYLHIRNWRLLVLGVLLLTISFIPFLCTLLSSAEEFLVSGNFFNLFSSLIAPLFLPSLLIVLASFYLFIFLPRKIHRLFKNQKTKIMYIETETTISPQVIEVISEISMARWRISDFYMYRANSNFVLLYLSSILYVPFPRHSFRSDADFYQFIGYLKVVFGKSGKPLKRKFSDLKSLPYRASSSSDSTIILRGHLIPADYTKARYLHLRPTPILKYILITLSGFYLCITGFLAYSAFALNLNTALFVLLLGIGIVIILLYFILIPLVSRRIFSQQANLHSEFQVEISPEMIETSSAFGTLRMRLADIYKYKIGKDIIILYRSDYFFQMLPRRWFPSEADFQTFLSYLQENLGPPKP